MFGDRPVIAAGSTGSIPATADLLRAIAELPRGALVLPGLDTSLDAEAFAALQKADAPAARPSAVRPRAAGAGARVAARAWSRSWCPAPSPRTAVLNRALALAEDTARGPRERDALAPQMPAAAEGLTLLAARTEEGEARAIALAARDAVANGRTVGIVTPDRNLARRIAAELLRFGSRSTTPPARRCSSRPPAAWCGRCSPSPPTTSRRSTRSRSCAIAPSPLGLERNEVRRLDRCARLRSSRQAAEARHRRASRSTRRPGSLPLLDALAAALAPLQILLARPDARGGPRRRRRCRPCAPSPPIDDRARRRGARALGRGARGAPRRRAAAAARRARCRADAADGGLHRAQRRAASATTSSSGAGSKRGCSRPT